MPSVTIVFTDEQWELLRNQNECEQGCGDPSVSQYESTEEMVRCVTLHWLLHGAVAHAKVHPVKEVK